VGTGISGTVTTAVRDGMNRGTRAARHTRRPQRPRRNPMPRCSVRRRRAKHRGRLRCARNAASARTAASALTTVSAANAANAAAAAGADGGAAGADAKVATAVSRQVPSLRKTRVMARRPPRAHRRCLASRALKHHPSLRALRSCRFRANLVMWRLSVQRRRKRRDRNHRRASLSCGAPRRQIAARTARGVTTRRAGASARRGA
jgi:hypothetical protein